MVRFDDIDPADLKRRSIDRAKALAAEFRPAARVPKYIARGQFLEALGAYRKFLLDPLIEMLRLRHCPLVADYGLVQASKHLPGNVVTRLEQLHAVTSIADIAQRLPQGEDWFWATAREVSQT